MCGSVFFCYILCHSAGDEVDGASDEVDIRTYVICNPSCLMVKRILKQMKMTNRDGKWKRGLLVSLNAGDLQMYCISLHISLHVHTA